jgi:hypothetical protein
MARSLAKANVSKAIKAALGQDADPAALAPGHMRLYSFYMPILYPGLYGIEAEQVITSTISGSSHTINVFNYQNTTGNPAPTAAPNAPTLLQQFNVVAPQFQIDPTVVNSFYPPPGHLDEGRVLPHIVFNDPHLPWDRQLLIDADTVPSAPSVPSQPPSEPAPQTVRSRSGPITLNNLFPASHLPSSATVPESVSPDSVRLPPRLPPWMALVVFDPSELKLASTDETALGIPILSAPTVPNTTAQPQQPVPNPGQVATPNAYPMTVGQYLTNITSRVKYEAGYTTADEKTAFQALQASTDPTTIIFPQKSLVQTIFNPTTQFLLMSHVRQIDTTGFPDAGVEEDGLYSVCISKRTGITSYPSTNPSPIPMTQVVHLVSLEYIQQSDLTSTNPSDRIGLVSLYSWTYLSVPPNPVNFQTTMANLANNLQMLTAPQSSLASLSSSIATQKTPQLQEAAQQLYNRLSLGYTISRWRTAVGQETVAFTRGPLTPLPTPWKPSVANDWPGSSNTGKEYQILDQTLGVMDLSYSSAWQLGKLMAISDNVFNKALFRFRSLVHNAAASDTQNQVNGVLSKAAVLKNIAPAIGALKTATNGSNSPARVILPSSDTVAPPLSHPQVAPVFTDNLFKIIDAQTAAGEAIYTDYNLGSANNTDWEIINQWISDKLFLGGIPAQYLIPDPSMLPSEALRFFYIDSAWMDCFIDGALSVANHLEPLDDKVRRRIKDVYNVYLSNNIDPAPVKPPVPEYGFILRSALIKVMPDIRVTVTCRIGTAPNYTPDPTRAPLVRLTRLDDYTIMGLVNCMPEEIYQIVFAQPPHQQRYVAAAQLDPTPEYQIRQLYETNAPTGLWPSVNPLLRPTAAEMATWYDPNSRCVNILQMAVDLVAVLNQTGDFSDYPDSVNFALELNDPSYQLQILPPTGSNPSTAPVQNRQLWVGTDVTDPSDPIPSAQPVIVPILGPTPISPLTQPVSSPITVHPAASPTSNPANTALPLSLSSPQVIQAPSKATAAVTASSALTSQFSLAVHPDYHGPPPLPFTAADGTITYSANDFIPTATTYLFDLIFSLQHQPPTLPIPYPLVSITVSIPTDTSTSSTVSTREPLITSTYASRGAIMLSNKRLIPTLTSSSGSLHIDLTPRDALPDSITTDSIAAVDMTDASFKLLAPVIAGIVNVQTLNVVGGAGTVARSLCKVRVTEAYLMSDGTTSNVHSSWNIVKRAGGDVGLNGNPV